MDNAYVISIEKNLTSFTFYNSVLYQLHNYFAQKNDEQIVFDFSKTKGIDALVLPNMLCAGFWILKHQGVAAKIYVPGNLEFTGIRTFLNDVGFVPLAQKYGLFKFDETISSGLNDRRYRDSLNKMQLFQYNAPLKSDSDVAQVKQLMWEQLKASFVPFISTFIQKSTNPYVIENKEKISWNLLSFNRELIENSLFHGRSFCFLAMQYISINQPLIKISISDCGMGFRSSLNWDRSRSLEIIELQRKMQTCNSKQEREIYGAEIEEIQNEGLRLNDEDITRLSEQPYLESELEAIIYGLLTRHLKPYGLYNIHKIVRSMGGTIRIHSEDTRLILSPRMGLPLEVGVTPQGLLRVLESSEYRAKNIQMNRKFKGTHIEMDISLGAPREE